MKTNQKGFGLIGIIFAVLVLLAISAAGYYVYNSQKANRSESSNDLNSRSETVANVDKKNNSSSEYLEIKELGIKLKTSHASKLTFIVKDESGTLPHSDSEQYDSVVVFRFKPEFVSDDECAPGLDLYRLKSTASREGLSKVGSHYYVFDGAPGNCSTENSGNQADDELKTSVLQDFKEKNLEVL